MSKREKETIQIGQFLLERVIGKRPRKPQTYEMRKRLGKPEDIAFCEDYDKRLEEWDNKAEIERKRLFKKREKEIQKANAFVIPEKPEMKIDYKTLIGEFQKNYKKIKKVDFNLKNPYLNNSDEPHQYIATLIFYFLKDERFFNSPLLRKDLSTPSFRKGTLTVGLSGCGKTSTWKALLKTFAQYIKYCEKQIPKNLSDIKTNFDINQCVSSEVVKDYNVRKDKESIFNPLYSTKQLYIDDIIREENTEYGKNIFRDVLTYRADRDRITHLTLNFVKEFDEIDGENGKILIPKTDTSKALYQFQTRYDDNGRLYDRIFGNYNIIELKGRSFRR